MNKNSIISICYLGPTPMHARINKSVPVFHYQAVRIKSAVELVFALNEIIQVITIVISLDKNRLAIVSSMDHMMRVVRNDKSTDTGHKAFIQKATLN